MSRAALPEEITKAMTRHLRNGAVHQPARSLPDVWNEPLGFFIDDAFLRIQAYRTVAACSFAASGDMEITTRVTPMPLQIVGPSAAAGLNVIEIPLR